MVKILAAVRIQLDVRLQRGQILGQIYKEGKSSLIAASETIDTARPNQNSTFGLAGWLWMIWPSGLGPRSVSQSIIMSAANL